MKNPFPSIGRFFKRAAKSKLIRQIVAAAFTFGGLPAIGAAIRKVDEALESGMTWGEIKSGLLEQALANPEQAALILDLIRTRESASKQVKVIQPLPESK